MNQCGLCRLDFAGLEDFDAHHVGTHEYTYWEGARMEPPHADGRRCLARVEMIEDGWGQNAHGRWLCPRNVRKQGRQGRLSARRSVARPRSSAAKGGRKVAA